jgi:hypothetical protein
MTHHYEIRSAVGTRGQSIYLVAAVRSDGQWANQQFFNSKAEALAWCKAQVSPFDDLSW